MSNRDHQIKAFLADCGWAKADRRPLFDDASNRKYERLYCRESGRRAVLMNAPPDSCGSLQSFKSVTSFLRGLGLSAPEIYEYDDNAGLMLLEDLGDDLVARLLERTPGLEAEIYRAAIDVLAVFRSGKELRPFPEHSPEMQSELASLAIDWYLPNATGAEPSTDLRSEFKGIIKDLVAEMGAPSLFVHRDFHAENIIWLPERDGLKRVGLLDYQDGALGYRAYDLVSLLEDARRDIPDLLRNELVMRFAQAAKVEPELVETELAISGAQRNLRILGVFTRLAVRDRKRGYVRLIPRVWNHLQRDLCHPRLFDLANFVEQHFPYPDTEARGRIDAQRN